MALVLCPQCHADVSSWATSCPGCGYPISPTGASSFPLLHSHPEKNKALAAVLAILLGTFGVHKFYLGQTRKGLLYLLFCWTGVPSLIALVEGCRYALMSDERFEEQYE